MTGLSQKPTCADGLWVEYHPDSGHRRCNLFDCLNPFPCYRKIELALLRVRRDWPRCRAAKKSDELAPPHCSPFEFQSPLSYRIKQ
jgi:hypothetical protein